MYFDTLPIETFPNIIDYVFLETYFENRRNLDASSKMRKLIRSLSMVVSDDSPFRAVISQLSFIKVHLVNVRATYLNIDNGSLVMGPELFENEGLEPGIPERIFQLSGKSVKNIEVYINACNLYRTTAENNRIIQKFVTLVKRHCPNVEKLSFMSLGIEGYPDLFENDAPKLLEQFSSQLRSIVWKVGATDKDCFRLPSISMCSHIRELKFPASPQLISFLHAFGASLESLTVLDGAINGYPEMLDVIEHKCTKLTAILFHDLHTVIESVGDERYASLLCSFGSQLISIVFGAAFDMISIENLTRIVRACPNLLIHRELVDEDLGDEWERLDLLGPMITNLTIAAGLYQDEKFKETIGRCTKLESLLIDENFQDEEQEIESSSNMDFLGSISSSSLTELGHHDFTASQKNIFVLSSALRNLDHLGLTLVKPIESGIDFKTIAGSNPQLKSICIAERRYRDENRKKEELIEILRMLVSAFSMCKSVDFTLISNGEESVTRNELRDICGSLPCRGVFKSIIIGSTHYVEKYQLRDN